MRTNTRYKRTHLELIDLNFAGVVSCTYTINSISYAQDLHIFRFLFFFKTKQNNQTNVWRDFFPCTTDARSSGNTQQSKECHCAFFIWIYTYMKCDDCVLADARRVWNLIVCGEAFQRDSLLNMRNMRRTYVELMNENRTCTWIQPMARFEHERWSHHSRQMNSNRVASAIFFRLECVERITSDLTFDDLSRFSNLFFLVNFGTLITWWRFIDLID